MATIKKRIKDKGNMAVWGRTLLLILLALTIVFPLYMTVIIAFKQPTEMTNDVSGALALPRHFSFQNFIQAIQTTDFFHTIGNSLFITIVTLIVVVIFHSMAAYAIGRKMNKHKSFNFLYLYFISGMFVPFSMLMLPLVKETSIIGIDNKLGLIILYTVFFFPMNLLLYAGYLKNIPLALEEAAYVDGATTWTTFWKVIFPLLKPMHATVIVLTALSVWNDVMTPLVILSGGSGKDTTLPLAQLLFQTQFGTNYNLAFASYLLALVPILILYLFAQKQIINGVVNGSVK